jgi:chaperonin cofactor prefoldin
MKRAQRDIKKAADRGNEMEVRQLAKNFISLQKQHKSRVAQLDKVTNRLTSMTDLHVGGLVDNDMVEFVQCYNDLTATVSNPRNIARTMGRFTMQKEALKMGEEMINDALEESEENEEEEEVNKAVEELVGSVMSQASMTVLNQLPTIKSSNHNSPLTTNKDPRVATSKIQEFFDKK